MAHIFNANLTLMFPIYIIHYILHSPLMHNISSAWIKVAAISVFEYTFIKKIYYRNIAIYSLIMQEVFLSVLYKSLFKRFYIKVWNLNFAKLKSRHVLEYYYKRFYFNKKKIIVIVYFKQIFNSLTIFRNMRARSVCVCVCVRTRARARARVHALSRVFTL